MRIKEEQEELDRLSLKEKMNRTRISEMKKRGVVVKEFHSWVLCRNEYPHSERGDNQFVLWARHPGCTSLHYNYSFYEAIRRIDTELGDTYRIVRHAGKEKSCIFREHFHVYEVF